jgi:ribosome-associated heat shock protein Hsp15
MTAQLKTRLDRWLWYARFFKTRALARQAVDGGRVRVGGARVKPGRAVKPGDVIEIRRADERYEVTVLQFGTRRGPAAEAQQLYTESAASRDARLAAAERRRELAAAGPAPSPGRPTKRDRRRLRAFRDGSG